MRTEHYPAIVTSIEEVTPKVGRIFVKCLQLTGSDIEFPEPLEPVHDWGWFYIPDIDEEVEVEVVVDDDNTENVRGHSFIENSSPRWRSKRFRSDNGDAPRPPNSQFTEENYGKRRGFATPKGHVLMFDDTDGSEEVRITWSNGTDVSTIKFGDDGSVEMTDKAGNKLTLNGIDTASMTAPKTNLNANGTADQHIPRGEDLLQAIQTLVTQLQSHTHTVSTTGGPTAQTGLAAPTATVFQAPQTSTLSTDAMVK